MDILLVITVFLVLVYTIVLLALAFGTGIEFEQRRTAKKVEKVFADFYPRSPDHTINSLKWKVREELGIEQPKNARRPYY